MADQVKGRDLSRFSKGVRTGIKLHRHIDHFTDTHSLNVDARRNIRPQMGKYAGVVLDVFQDHFLAKHWTRYHSMPLHKYVEEVYSLLTTRSAEMPERTQFLFGYMKEQDWLGNYATVQGIDRALQGLARRAVNGAQMTHAKEVLVDNYEMLETNFSTFFPAVQTECARFLRKARQV